MNADHKPGTTPRSADAAVALSLVIASRNDRHQGNSVRRLETALDFVAASVATCGRADAVEVVVADWGSTPPLAQVLRLTPAAQALTVFVEIPPALARERQGDSPFPEVLALNAAVRRSRGRWIGRIDQDTLVTTRFVESWFAQCTASGSLPAWADGFAFLRRRSLPYAVCRREPDAATLRSMIDAAGRRCPTDSPHASPWFDAPVGIVLLSRERWHEVHGYDERLRHWGWMETDLGLRVGLTHPLHDLQALGFAPLYHIEHRAWRTPWIPRRRNPRLTPAEPAPAAATWGLVDADLPMTRSSAPAAESRAEANDRSTWLWVLWRLSLPAMWIRHGAYWLYGRLRALAGRPRLRPAPAPAASRR